MNKGKFIVFEGGEGSGKSTILNMIYNYFIENNIDCIMTREPGGIAIAEEIRHIILDPKNTSMDERTEALLYAAARRQHLVEKVMPALKQGKIVLCDRFICSSLAYQGHARGLGIDEVFKINQFAIDDCIPNLNILFDLDPEIGLARINSSEEREINRLDLEKMDFHYKVREGYNELYNKNNFSIIKIDASKTIEDVFTEVKNIILREIM